jgi:hypothetical protein
LRAIFVSYRRHDAEGEAGRLFDDLVEQFGEHSVFMDVAAIEVGRDFRKAIDESIATCGVLLAIMGQGWLNEKNESGSRRLEDPTDFVRAEIASALTRDIPVVPVLVRGARMPRADQLPEDIKDLAYRNAVELTHVRWKSDIKLLIRSLRSLLGDSRDIVAARGVKASPDSVFLGKSTLWSGSEQSPNASDTKATTGPMASLQDGGGQRAPLSSANAVSRNSNTAQISPQYRSPSSSGPNTTPTPAESSCGAKLDPQAISRITEELADYIGPIAEVVVKRAAKQCATVADLRRAVAEEIETSAERVQFLDACRGT